MGNGKHTELYKTGAPAESDATFPLAIRQEWEDAIFLRWNTPVLGKIISWLNFLVDWEERIAKWVKDNKTVGGLTEVSIHLTLSTHLHFSMITFLAAWSLSIPPV